MHTTETFAAKLGRKDMAAALGVGLTAISKEVISGTFPPGWYLALRELCDRRGEECPEYLFKWKSPSSKTLDGGSCLSVQHTSDAGKILASTGRNGGAA